VTDEFLTGTVNYLVKVIPEMTTTNAVVKDVVSRGIY